MEPVKELIERVFTTRNSSHFAHWSEKSGYLHTVLGGFYDDVIDKLDIYIELYQGAFEKISFGNMSFECQAENTAELISRMDDDLMWIEKSREKITNGVPPLDNALHDLESVYLTTLYKLRNLK